MMDVCLDSEEGGEAGWWQRCRPWPSRPRIQMPPYVHDKGVVANFREVVFPDASSFQLQETSREKRQ